jgi:hypothetical protein
MGNGASGCGFRGRRAVLMRPGLQRGAPLQLTDKQSGRLYGTSGTVPGEFGKTQGNGLLAAMGANCPSPEDQPSHSEVLEHDLLKCVC